MVSLVGLEWALRDRGKLNWARLGKFALGLAGMGLALSGCGGSGSNDSPPVQQGVFIDSPVAGLAYETESRSGLTNEFGQFDYLDGETVTFTVGTLELGAAIAAEQVFVKDLFPGEEELAPAGVNIARLLLLLDSDNNATNGIQIDESTRSAALNWSQIDFTSDELDATFDVIAQSLGKDTDNATAFFAASHLLRSLNCRTGGLYADPVGGTNGGELLFAVTPEGVVQGVDVDGDQTALSVVRYPGGSASFDTESDPFSVARLPTPIPIDPLVLPDQVRFPVVGVGSNGLAPLKFQRFQPVSNNPPEPYTWNVVGDVTPESLVGEWRQDGAVGAFDAARLVPIAVGERRVLVNYSNVISEPVSSIDAGMIDIVVRGDLTAEGYVINWQTLAVIPIAGSVTSSDSGEQQLLLTGDGGFSVSYQYDEQSGRVSPNVLVFGMLSRVYSSQNLYEPGEVLINSSSSYEGLFSSLFGFICL